MRLLQLIFSPVNIYLGIIELRSVPATNPVVRPELPVYGVLVGLGLVPLGEQEHVLTVLVGEPSYRGFSIEGLILSEEL